MRLKFSSALAPLAVALIVAMTPLARVQGVPIRHSDQFTVIDARPAAANFPGRLRSPSGEELVKLDVDVLLMSAERIREMLLSVLGTSSQGANRIRLMLYPATRAGETVALISSFSPSGWEYRVNLPDQVEEQKLVRAVVQALLLEFANRGHGPKPAELPWWLVEGLTWHIAAVAGHDLVVGSVPLGSMLRIVRERRGLDHLQAARQVLRSSPPLAFADLAYPKPEQLTGDKLKVFQCSAQLFVYELLHSKDGAANLQTMLRELPNCWNWETALLRGFASEFSRMLDVEKKWSVDVLAFVARDPSQVWSRVACLDRLDEVLAVPAKVRVGADLLPERKALSLQQVIASWETSPQLAILRQKLSLLEVLRFNATPELVPLIDAYRQTLASYVQKREAAARAPQTRMQTTLSASLVAQDAIKDLEQLDKRRQAFRPERTLSANPL